MASYQSLASAGSTNIGYISKNLKELSTKIKISRSLQNKEFQDALSEINSFHEGVKELVLHCNVPKEQSAKKFALKNQYQNLISCHSAILDSRAKISELESLGENASKEQLLLNGEYEDHENIHKDICGLYEIFKEFEEEEIKKQAKNRENLKNDQSYELSDAKEMRLNEKEELNEKHQELNNKKGDVQVVCSQTQDQKEDSSKYWIILLAVIIITLSIILGIWLA